MLNSAPRIPLKNLYHALKSGKELDEMQWSLVAETVLPIKMPRESDPADAAYADLREKIEPVVLEYGEAIEAQGMSPDKRRHGYSDLDLMKFRILEGARDTLSDIRQLHNLSHLTGMTVDETVEMMQLSRDTILQKGIEPMHALEKGMYNLKSIVDPALKPFANALANFEAGIAVKPPYTPEMN